MNYLFDIGAQVEYDSNSGLSTGEVVERTYDGRLTLNVYGVMVYTPYGEAIIPVYEPYLRINNG